MARYKPANYEQDKFIPISYSKQILPGTFEYTLSYLIDKELDLSVFDTRYRNDETGAPAIDPAVLLKVVIYAYSRGITSSRKIAQACRENVIFMALSADTQPHFTTLADFVSGMDAQIVPLFRSVLMICDEMKLIGGDMFAIDGCKLPSNASKGWSGTKAELRKKKTKLDEAAKAMLKRHRETDYAADPDQHDKEAQAIESIKAKAKKIKDWLDDNDDKPGSGGRPKKSNITDNESAKIKTGKGVIQGYNGVSCVDSGHQIVVHAEAYGVGPEQALLQPMLEGVSEHFDALGKPDILKRKTVTADSGFYNKANVTAVWTQGIDAYLPDTGFRKRDPRFTDAPIHQARARKEHQKIYGVNTEQYTAKDFDYDAQAHTCRCPAGKQLYSNGRSTNLNGYEALKFRGAKRDCMPCTHRDRCMKDPSKTQTRQVAIFLHKLPNEVDDIVEKMKAKIDTAQGRYQYSRRMAIVEPVFGHITSAMGLNRFSLRTRKKVDIQWKLYNLVHNLLKIHRYGPLKPA